MKLFASSPIAAALALLAACIQSVWSGDDVPTQARLEGPRPPLLSGDGSPATTASTWFGLPMMLAAAPLPPHAAPSTLPVEGLLPDLAGATAWLNSPPLSARSLRGKVVLIDFWTYSCSNCLNALPHVRAWAEKYKDQGLVVVGVHSPEFAVEREVGNVERAVRELGLAFPIAIDNNFAIWRSFANQYWPAHYFVDARGRIRFHHFGEGAYERSEQVIRQLLDEAHGRTEGARP